MINFTQNKNWPFLRFVIYIILSIKRPNILRFLGFSQYSSSGFNDRKLNKMIILHEPFSFKFLYQN
jgi:hypothetical protein